MTTVISIVLVIGALIFFHELGHLIFAKRAGILCREFAIGFGPKLFSVKKNETLYSIRIIPIGGYVRMAGEDPELIPIRTGYDVGLILNQENIVEKIIAKKEMDDPQAVPLNVQSIDIEKNMFIEGYDAQEQLQRYDVHPQATIVYDQHEIQVAPYDRQFGSKTKTQRALTLFAGPFANFVLAFVILVGLGIGVGVPVDEPLIHDVEEGSAASDAGLLPGDQVVAIDDTRIQSWQDMVEIIVTSPGEELNVVVKRDGNQLQIPVVPDTQESNFVEGGEEGFLGIGRAADRGVFTAVQYGWNTTIEFSLLIFQGLGMLISGGAGIDDLAGPVGIFDYTGQFAQQGLMSLLHWTAILSVNLAILNLLPIPALDGGRLLFIAVEAVRGRPIDPQKEGLLHFFGFALLMLLILVITWNDIQRLFN